MKIRFRVKEDKELDAILRHELPVAPPETRFLSERYIVELPIASTSFDDPWQLRVHVAKVLESHLGDEVQLTSMKIRHPHLVAKTKAKLLKREPCARAFVTIKF
ncbi:MAG: hypothetical protein ACREGG_01735 [Candidatus Saccharimonadales bacterium]